jgi:hypothetical protein
MALCVVATEHSFQESYAVRNVYASVARAEYDADEPTSSHTRLPRALLSQKVVPMPMKNRSRLHPRMERRSTGG